METIDLMDPRRRRQHSVRLGLGYILIAIALVLATTVLLFVAYGFGLKDGRVVQNGLIFVSSTPSSAQVYLNGSRYRDTTNTKLVLTEGNYQVMLKRSGYRDWQRKVAVRGGLVESINYPLLFPTSLTAKTLASTTASPALNAQSPDRRWLVLAQPLSLTTFDIYDLTASPLTIVHLTLPNTLGVQDASAVQPVAWSDDNRHLLVRFTVKDTPIYVLVDTQAIDQSRNLTALLSLTAETTVTMVGGHAGQYYMWNSSSHLLQTASLDDPTPKVYLQNVLAFAGGNDHHVLYATPDALDAQKTTIALYDGNTSYSVRRAKTSSTYLLALGRHGNDEYAAMYASSETQAFVYQNPLNQLSNQQRGVAIPAQVLYASGAQTVRFAPGGQYVAFGNGLTEVVYDVANASAAQVQLPGALATDGLAPTWIDGAHLSYVSGGRLMVCDYDGQNCQLLISARPELASWLDPSSKMIVADAPAASGGDVLVSASLRTAADQ